MRFRSSTFAELLLVPLTLTFALCASGCTELRGRKKIQEANELYHRGKYREAIALYEDAESLVPQLPTLWLNKGYTCRELIAPGGKDAESREAAACAIAAFRHMALVAPNDVRPEQLIIQTWFDIDDFDSLERTFRQRYEHAPTDLEAIRGLQAVYYRAGKWSQALDWSKRAATVRPADPEAQYGVGTLTWQILSSRGGGTEMAGFNPWPRAAGAGNRPESGADPQRGTAPVVALSDISGGLRVQLADQGIAYLERAVALRPRYPEAMTYLALLWRQKSFAFFDDPIAWQGAVDQADDWQRRALAARAGRS